MTTKPDIAPRVSPPLVNALELVVSEISRDVARRLAPQIDNAMASDQGLTRQQAAEKLGIGLTKFRGLLNGHKMPRPNPFTGTWSSRELDRYLSGAWKPTRRGR